MQRSSRARERREPTRRSVAGRASRLRSVASDQLFSLSISRGSFRSPLASPRLPHTPRRLRAHRLRARRLLVARCCCARRSPLGWTHSPLPGALASLCSRLAHDRRHALGSSAHARARASERLDALLQRSHSRAAALTRMCAAGLHACLCCHPQGDICLDRPPIATELRLARPLLPRLSRSAARSLQLASPRLPAAADRSV